MEKQFKKGDIVCVYYFHPGKKEIHETEIVSAGKKYITTRYDQSNKFDSESLYSNWGGYSLFKGTKEECETYISKLEDAKTKCREISKYFDTRIDDFDLINQVYDLIVNKKN